MSRQSARGRYCDGPDRNADRLRLRGLRVCSDDALEIWIRQAPDSDSAKTAQKLADGVHQGQRHQDEGRRSASTTSRRSCSSRRLRRDLPDIVINDTAQLGNMQTQGWLREVDKASLAGGDKVSETAWKAATASDGKYYGRAVLRPGLRPHRAQGLAGEGRPGGAQDLGRPRRAGQGLHREGPRRQRPKDDSAGLRHPRQHQARLRLLVRLLASSTPTAATSSPPAAPASSAPP